MNFSKKPLVGLNADYVAAHGNRDAYSFIWAGYSNSISRAGGIPVVIPPSEDEHDVEAVLDILDGVVLTGGGDLNPVRDGFLMHPSVRPMHPKREDFDRMLMRLIAKKKKPVLAIGVGMQLMNVTLGGNLFFHIPIDIPKAMPHFDRNCSVHRHTLDVVQDSIMGRVYGDAEIRVTSQHHMAVNELGEGLRVTATSPDGIIEAIESTEEDWLAIGTQFHPESSSATQLDYGIFQEFLIALGGIPYEMELAAAA